MFVTYPAYVIAVRLSLSKATVHHWVSDIPLGRPRRWNAGQRKGTRDMQRKYAVRRAAAFLQGRIEFADLIEEPTFRDFLCLYMAEGYKRSRNTVAVCSSDHRIVVLCARWIRRFTSNKIRYAVQYHADQDLDELRRFWAARLAVTPGDINVQRKSNSGKLAGRTWRSKHGVLTVSVGDTRLRARLEGWMHGLQDLWLHSPDIGA